MLYRNAGDIPSAGDVGGAMHALMMCSQRRMKRWDADLAYCRERLIKFGISSDRYATGVTIEARHWFI